MSALEHELVLPSCCAMSVSVSTRVRVRAWCFTLKSHDDELIARLKGLKCERMVVGRERGESGYEHLQGYVRFTQPQGFSWWKNQFPSAHVEPRKGKESEATAYCAKEGDVVIDVGVDCDEVVKAGMNKHDEAAMIIEEVEKGARYGQIRARHKVFCFWHRRNVLDYIADQRFIRDYPDTDPT